MTTQREPEASVVRHTLSSALTSAGEARLALSFREVTKRYGAGRRTVLVLDGASFELGVGESLGLYGAKRSGKSSLLRLAAGIDVPDSGKVWLFGRDVTRMPVRTRARLLRESVALLTSSDWLASANETVLDHVAISLGSSDCTLREARRRALAALERVGVASIAAQDATGELSWSELARVGLARALVREPRLLLVDEPVPMPSSRDRDRFCALLRELAREREMALLIASEDMSALQGMSVLVAISGGELCSTDRTGAVVELAPRRAAALGHL